MLKKSLFLMVVVVFVAGLLLMGCQPKEADQADPGDEEKYA